MEQNEERMAIDFAFTKQLIEAKLNNIGNVIQNDDAYFLTLEERPLLYGDETILNEDGKQMVLKLDLIVSYKEMKT